MIATRRSTLFFRWRSGVQSNHPSSDGRFCGEPAVFSPDQTFSPILLAEWGALVNCSNAEIHSPPLLESQTQSKRSFVYGGGVNYPILKRVPSA